MMIDNCLLLVGAVSLMVLLCSRYPAVQGWAPPSPTTFSREARTTPTSRQHPWTGRIIRMMAVDPASIAALVGDADVALEVGVALVGAAAGAASQLPRVQALQEELAAVKLQLKETETRLEDKIHVLEDKLFAMDEEFEVQTAKFQRQYDQTQKKRLEEIKDKLKTEMEYKLEIQIAQQKSKILMDSVTLEHGRTGKQEELSQLKLRSSQLEDLNAQLEATLKETDQELQTMRAQSSKKKFLFW